MSTERRRVFYAGRVQGVGFRFTAARLAQVVGLRGYVRNLPDGVVELVVEGEPTKVDQFLGSIRGEFGDRIRSESSTIEPTGEESFDDFSIRHGTQ